MMADQTKPDLQNMLNALSMAAPQFVAAQAVNRADVYDVAEKVVDGIEQSLNEKVKSAIIDATNMIMAAKRNNQSITEYVTQQGLFEQVDEATASLAVFLATHARSSKKMAQYFKAMADFIKNDSESRQTLDMFGEKAPINLADVMAYANSMVNPDEPLEFENENHSNQNNGNVQLSNSDIQELGSKAGNPPLDTVTAIRSAKTSDEVRILLEPIVQKPLYNETLGFYATISNRTLEKMLSGKATKKSFNTIAHLNTIANIDVLFAKAILDLSEPEKNGDEQTLGIHKLKVKLTSETGDWLVKITVKELLNDGNRIYSVEAIEEDSVVPELTAPQDETSRLHNAIEDNNTLIKDENQYKNESFELQAILSDLQAGILTPADLDLAEIDRLIADKAPENEAVLGQIMDIIANSYQEKL